MDINMDFPQWNRTNFCFALMMCVTGPVSALDEDIANQPYVTINRCVAPVMDGNLEEPCWLQAAPLQDFTRLDGLQPAGDRTVARLACDDANLYLGVACSSSRPPQSDQTERDHPELWRDDHIEMFIDPSPDTPDNYQVQINTNGAWLDQKIIGHEPRDPSWNIELNTRVLCREDGYTVEAAIPFAGLGLAPEEGTDHYWRFNLCRGIHGGKELTSWSRVRGTFYAPERFGAILFAHRGPYLNALDPLPTFPGSHILRMTLLPNEQDELNVRIVTEVQRERGGTIRSEQTIQHYGRAPYETTVPISLPSDTESIRLEMTLQPEKHPLYSTGLFPIEAGPPLEIDTGDFQTALANLEAASGALDIAQILERGHNVLARVQGVKKEQEEYFATVSPSIDRWHQLPLRAAEVAQEVRQTTILAQTRLHDLAMHRQPSDFAVLVYSPMLKVEQSATPPGIVDGSVAIELAQNEYESAQFTLWPMTGELKDVSVRITDLVSPDRKAVILSHDINLNLVGFVQCREPEYTPDLTGSLPDPLLPYREFSVPAGTHQPIWLTVHVSQAIPAGVYEGNIEIQPAGKAPRAIPLNVHVYDFALEKMHLTTAFAFFESEVKSWYGINGDIPQDLLRKYYEFLLSYRLNPTNIYSSEPNPRKEDIPFCLERGMTAYNVKHIGRGIAWTPEEEKEILGFFDSYYPFLKDQELLDIAYCYSFDEPNEEDYPTIRKIFDLMGSRYPGLKRATTEPPCDALAGSVDIYVPLTSQYNEETCRARQAAGDDIWWYVCVAPKHPYANFFTDYRGIDHRILFWQTWKYQVTGFLYYAINLWRSNLAVEPTREIVPFDDPALLDAVRSGKRWPEIPWNSHTFTRHNGDGHLIYPGPDNTLFASLRLALIRDGIEDYEYLYLLRERLHALLARKKQSPDVVTLTDEAAQVLSVSDTLAKSLTEYTNDPEILMQERRHAAELIEQIDRKLELLK